MTRLPRILHQQKPVNQNSGGARNTPQHFGAGKRLARVSKNWLSASGPSQVARRNWAVVRSGDVTNVFRRSLNPFHSTLIQSRLIL